MRGRQKQELKPSESDLAPTGGADLFHESRLDRLDQEGASEKEV